jgi:hypothetical protein
MKKYVCMVVLCTLASVSLFAQQGRMKSQKSEKLEITPALEQELFAVEKQWMGGEHDKNMALLETLWTDQFFDVLTGGAIVSKHEMMDRLSKGSVVPGTGAFPDDFKVRAIYGNVVLATDHTVIKAKDASGNIVVTREMRCLRMFVRENGKWRVAGAGLVPITSQ